ncbi:hypothetical protein [Mesobacillus foraminis]|nr:hypothetical protein [Mesobacillus foraminis]
MSKPLKTALCFFADRYSRLNVVGLPNPINQCITGNQDLGDRL